MTKTKNIQYELKEMASSIYRPGSKDLGNLSLKTLLLYCTITIILLTIIAMLNNSLENTSQIAIASLILIGLPIIFIMLFSIFYIFLNAFENTRKPFFKSYLIVFAFTLPFIIIGNFLNYIGKIFFNNFTANIILLLLVILIIYYFIAFTKMFNKYYKTNYSKIATSLILVFMFFTFIYILEYLRYIILNIK